MATLRMDLGKVLAAGGRLEGGQGGLGGKGFSTQSAKRLEHQVHQRRAQHPGYQFTSPSLDADVLDA